jgi:hypothetical protein
MMAWTLIAGEQEVVEVTGHGLFVVADQYAALSPSVRENEWIGTTKEPSSLCGQDVDAGPQP